MNKKIKIAVIDSVPKVFWDTDEGITDGDKFIDLLSPQNSTAEFDTFFAEQNELPRNIADYDAFMLSGSPSSVNDGLAWIDNLANLIRQVDAAKKPLIASCFGHQLVAKTFGGSIGKNENGWMIGNYELKITGQYDWMSDKVDSCNIYHFNKERVNRLPEAAVSFARSADYADYAFTLGDNILCMQGHPEQPLRAMNNFLKTVEDDMPADELAKARKMIDNGKPDAELWAQWMMNFFCK